ncbi:TetR family transcriptional regulator [Gordonia spumicola]|uniref:TetR family transcriptional regulator n=1 Tax=Gordonia spumicola TaxID=589161 RepID=A0A7I9VFU9_9ACTN|nr:TetR/AcrR family transcriptional regulator [Gordonia spumicola]GEE00783.1 TetR family transcriptional regulator [Gordonia spumicola]GEE04206.1 TetR family transcriptional regulator [Gordonia spumicola]GEE04216.1 TetR family transcriptional regulator [Gordonia spumicola]
MAPRPRSPRGSGEQLADEIIAATTDLLMELGSGDAVSIRAVAQRVGVTPPSIYLHFQDKDALLDAVCAHYYERFDDVMMAAGEGIDYLWERAVAQGIAYVRFAIENEVVFRTTFARVTEAGEPTLTDEVLLSSAFGHIRETIEEGMATGLIAPGDPVPVVMQVWSVAHGVACLMVTKPGLPWGDDLSTAEGVMRAVCTGLSQVPVNWEHSGSDVR